MSWNGLLLLNKPQDRTSHTVVQMIKTRLKASRAGHLGTLDPLATGVFPVCLGKATRLTPFYLGADKCYLTAIRFGFFTTTDDREGEQEGPYYKIRFTSEELEKTLATFQGNYQQKPPSYSAKKIKGKKAYQLARRGVKADLPSQNVTIFEIKLIRFEKDVAIISIHCSSGTYVRSIARDLGMKLNSGAHVQELTRTKFGDFALEQVVPPDAPMGDLQQSFIPMEKMLSHFPELVIDPTLARKILCGSAIEVKQNMQDSWIRVFSEEGNLLAIARAEPLQDMSRIQPKIVFN